MEAYLCLIAYQKHNLQNVGQKEKLFKPMLQRKMKSIFFPRYTLSMRLGVFKMWQCIFF